jgi:mannose-1-phosphate guanylyltransferase/mannose-6-phosphate isomerase
VLLFCSFASIFHIFGPLIEEILMIHPVLLCGGSGTRLWPLSRKSYPKQFAPLIGSESLFQASAMRLLAPEFAAPVIVTGSDFRFIVGEQLTAVGVEPSALLIEPDGRNTAPAVLAAALHIGASDPDALMLVSPSDHVIPDAAAFRRAVAAGVDTARDGRLVTFGIRPTHAETGYGWLDLADDPGDFAPRPISLRRFVEKPDAVTAEKMLAAGHYLWNAGIFLFSVRAIMTAFEKYEPDLLADTRTAVDKASKDLNFLRLDPASWEKIDPISIDYAVMERADNVSAVPFSAGWSDLGGWDAVWSEMSPDDQGVSQAGPVTAIDCTDTLLRSEADSLELVGIGLKDIIAVAMPDAVLIADRSRAQDVKLAVTALKDRGAKQAQEFDRDHRPWGWFETLALDDRFQVKRIVVKPGAALSLQSHMHRAEHWIVVQGTAKVTINDKVELITENQSVYVPLGAVHRMENPGKLPMVLIEVQTGSYLGEDDIIRYEDVYARGQGAKG